MPTLLPSGPKTLPRFWNVPNTLTVGRLALGLAVCGFIAANQYLAALVIFAVAALSDALDGYLARRLKQETPIGRQFDPLVDKLIVSGAMIFLLPVPGSGLPPWVVTTIVVRELIVQALRSLVEGKGEPFGAKMAGKLKMLFQCLAIAVILAMLGLSAQAAAWFWIRNILTGLAVALTVYSGCGYLILAWPILKGSPPPSS